MPGQDRSSLPLVSSPSVGGEAKPLPTNGHSLNSRDDTRREDILAATLRIAEIEGFDNVTVRKVATLAGVSSSLITYHFKSKERLILEAWTLLHDQQRLRRDAAVGRDSVLRRIEESFRQFYETPEATVSSKLRADFFAKTAKTPSLLMLFQANHAEMRKSHIKALEDPTLSEGIDPKYKADLELLEDAIQAMQYGVHIWAAIHTTPTARARATEVGRFLLSLFRDPLKP